MSRPELDLSIVSYTDRSVNLAWSVLNTSADHLFSILRGNSPSEMEEIATDLFMNSYVDDGLSSYSNNRLWFYRVIATNIDTGDTITSTIKYEHYKSDKIFMDVVRRDRLVLYPVRDKRPLVGVKCFLYPQKSWGSKCHVCWDSVKSRVRDDKCPECYSTGYSGGYFDPSWFYADFTPDSKFVNLMDYFEIQPSQSACWTTNYPPLSPRDVIIEEDGRRWIVVDVVITEYRRKRYRQLAHLDKIDRDDIKYQIPYPEDL